jgi:hypothetical protein
MAARKLAAMAVRVRPKREIIREPGEHKIPGGSTVFQRVLEGFFWGGRMAWNGIVKCIL